MVMACKSKSTTTPVDNNNPEPENPETYRRIRR